MNLMNTHERHNTASVAVSMKQNVSDVENSNVS